MLIKFPTDSGRIAWTSHIKNKMLYYGLSEQRLRRVMKSPDRVQEGIAEHTLSAMQKSRTRKNPEEIWLMYAKADKLTPTKGKRLTSKKNKGKILMISAWRYPGITKPGEQIPVPDDILSELYKII